VGEEMLMSRKMGSVVAVLAFLSLSTAGAVQARPVAYSPAAPSVAADLGRWLSSGLAAILNKDGIGLDPNGTKHATTRRVPGVGTQHGRVVSEGK
jgi:hypothetical protein